MIVSYQWLGVGPSSLVSSSTTPAIVSLRRELEIVLKFRWILYLDLVDRLLLFCAMDRDRGNPSLGRCFRFPNICKYSCFKIRFARATLERTTDVLKLPGHILWTYCSSSYNYFLQCASTFRMLHSRISQVSILTVNNTCHHRWFCCADQLGKKN